MLTSEALLTLTTHPSSGCPGLDALNPICQLAGGVASSVASAGADVFEEMAQWVVDGASWLLGQLGGVLNATTSINVGSSWFGSQYQVMLRLVGILALPLLLAATIQAVLRQSVGVLVRAVVVQLPLAMLLAGIGVQLVQLALAASDQLSAAVSVDSGGDIQRALSGVATALLGAAGSSNVPAFVVMLGALIVAFGAFVLWLELLVRAAAVYVAVLFLPLALASLIWPAISHWCRRLVETLAALILSKFVIVAILSLAAGAISSGTGSTKGDGAGFASVLGGGAILLLAAFSPFTLLRLVPLAEAGAIGHLEGARHRVQGAFGSRPYSAASFALRQARSGAMSTEVAGTGQITTPDPPGATSPANSSDAYGGIPMWQGETSSTESLEAMLPKPKSIAERGPIPIIGATSPRPDRGHLEIRRDDIGPVITWIRPEHLRRSPRESDD